MAQEAPETVILAEDEASLYLQATTQVVWHPRGQTPLVRLHPGRDNVHFYGTLDLHTGKQFVMASQLMNSEVTALYLQKLLLAYPNLPILLLWDRATWHRGPAIKAVLDNNPRMEILFFPPGSPDLNPQEHVWKKARENVSHNHSMTNLTDLSHRFASYLDNNTFPSNFLDLYGYNPISPMFI